MALAVLAAATVAAQAPPGQGDPISISASDSSITVTAEEATPLSLTVARPPITDSPLDEAMGQLDQGDVVVSVAGAPEGWTVTIQPDAFSLGPGEEREVMVEVLVEPASDADGAQLTFTARLTTPDPTGVLSPGGEASAEVEATRDDSATRQLLETLGPAVWAIMGALLVAIIVAVFLAVDRRTRVVELTTHAGEVKVLAGKTASVPFWIENRGKDTDRFAVSATTGDAAWKAGMAVTAISLEPGQREELHVAVTPTQKAPVGSRAVVRVIAVPDQAPHRIAVLAMSAIVEDKATKAAAASKDDKK